MNWWKHLDDPEQDMTSSTTTPFKEETVEITKFQVKSTYYSFLHMAV
jgi:hypothetical protein